MRKTLYIMLIGTVPITNFDFFFTYFKELRMMVKSQFAHSASYLLFLQHALNQDIKKKNKQVSDLIKILFIYTS